MWSDEMHVALGMRREEARKGGRVRWEDGLSPAKMLEVMMEEFMELREENDGIEQNIRRMQEERKTLERVLGTGSSWRATG